MNISARNIALFPIRRIVWGIFSWRTQTFISLSFAGQKFNEFDTWDEAQKCAEERLGVRSIAREMIAPRPKRVYAYDEMKPEDV